VEDVTDAAVAAGIPPAPANNERRPASVARRGKGGGRGGAGANGRE
jgi:hypothetical protein